MNQNHQSCNPSVSAIAVERSGIYVAIDALRMAEVRIDLRVKALIERLQPLLITSAVEAGDPVQEFRPCRASQLVNQLDGIANRLSTQEDLLADLLERLDI